MAADRDTATVIRPSVDEELDEASAFDHVTCCRGSWEVALCGADVSREPISLIMDVVCPQCLDEAHRRYAELGVNATLPSYAPICFETGRPCPQGDEAWRLMAKILERPEKL